MTVDRKRGRRRRRRRPTDDQQLVLRSATNVATAEWAGGGGNIRLAGRRRDAAENSARRGQIAGKTSADSVRYLNVRARRGRIRSRSES